MLAADVLRGHAERTPDRLAIDVDGFSQITYGDWDRRSNRLARALVELGVAPGDRVALRLENRDGVEYCVGYFACQKAGAVAVPINTRLAPREAAYILDHSEPRVILGHAEDRQRIAATAGSAKHSARLVLRGGVGEESWNELEDAESSDEFQVERAPDDLADILYTSGTTGRPKGVASTHSDVAAIAKGRAAQMFAGATFLHAFPLYTFAGTHGMTMLGLSGGMTTVVQPRFDPARFLALISERSVNLMYVAPAMILLMIDHPDASKHTYDTLKMILYGSAPMPPDAIPRLAKVFKEAFQVNVYGLTEAGSAACSLPPHEALERPGSIGKPLPPTEVSIRNDAGDPVPDGEHGEIWMRAAHARRRYFKDDDATARTWTEDGWLKTGDVGHFDADGYLYLDDRKKDVIVRGGHNVYPAEVEAALLEHPGIQEVAVVGVEHPVLGEDVKAVVVTRDGTMIDLDQLKEFCSERLADYKTPRHLEVLDELPRNSMGKVLRRVLRGEAGAVS